MIRFVKKITNEQGMTLIELIAVMSILSLVGGLVFSLIHFGTSSYEKIKIEQSLRDEADIIMSSIITELYTQAPEQMSENGNGFVMSGGALTDPKRIYISDGQLYIGDRVVEISAVLKDQSRLQLACAKEEAASRCSSGLINIKLELARVYGEQEYKLELESKFGF